MREFGLLHQRWHRAEEAAWQRSAQIVCMLANLNRRKGQAAYKLEDFMPREKQPEKVVAMRNQTFLQLAAARMRKQQEKAG